MIISKTPCRISFFGGGTDLGSFYQNHGYGAVLSTSINSYIHVIVKPHSEIFVDERIRLNYSESERVDSVEEIRNPILRECLKHMEIDERIYIGTVADAPGSSGLGSSSAFAVGLLNALYRYKGERESVGRLEEEAAHIEIDVLNRPMGKQDHYAAAYGGMNYFRSNDDGVVTVRSVNGGRKSYHQLFDSMLSFWLGQTRPSQSILKEQDDNNSKNSEVLLQMREQAELMIPVLEAESFDLEDFALNIDRGWQMKKSLASNISNSRYDELYDLAQANGAIGGKISGAGGGGFLNLFAPAEKHQQLSTILSVQGLVPCSFRGDSQGTQVNILS